MPLFIQPEGTADSIKRSAAFNSAIFLSSADADFSVCKTFFRFGTLEMPLDLSGALMYDAASKVVSEVGRSARLPCAEEYCCCVKIIDKIEMRIRNSVHAQNSY